MTAMTTNPEICRRYNTLFHKKTLNFLCDMDLYFQSLSAQDKLKSKPFLKNVAAFGVIPRRLRGKCTFSYFPSAKSIDDEGEPSGANIGSFMTNAFKNFDPPLAFYYGENEERGASFGINFRVNNEG